MLQKRGLTTNFFASDFFATKITNHFNKNHNLLQQKKGFASIKKWSSNKNFLHIHLQQQLLSSISTKITNDDNKKHIFATYFEKTHTITFKNTHIRSKSQVYIAAFSV